MHWTLAVRNAIRQACVFVIHFRCALLISLIAGYWLGAKVLLRKADCVLVHFIGWSSKYDETIPLSSGRLAIRGMKAQQPARKAKRKAESVLQPTGKKVPLDSADQTDSDDGNESDASAGECDGLTTSTPVGNITLGDCLLLQRSNRGATDELCTVTNVSRATVQLTCSWTGRRQTISVKDLTAARVKTFESLGQPSTKESSDESDGASGVFVPRDWSELVPARQYLPQCQYAPDAEQVVAEVNANNAPKKGVRYGACTTPHLCKLIGCQLIAWLACVHTCSSAENAYKSYIPPKAVKEALSNPKQLSTMVGVGEITDTCESTLLYRQLFTFLITEASEM